MAEAVKQVPRAGNSARPDPRLLATLAKTKGLDMKTVDITLRIPVDNTLGDDYGLTLAAIVRQIVLDNGSAEGIEEVQIVCLHTWDTYPPNVEYTAAPKT